jgi:hypothetical protein
MTTNTLTYNAGLGDCWGTTFAHLFDSTANEVLVGTDTTNIDRNVRDWFPFVVALSRGAKVISATLNLTAISTSSSITSSIQVGCEAADNVSTPSDENDLLARVFTTAVVNTTLVQYTGGVVYSYDVTAAVQEVLNRSSWANGNTLAVMIQDTDSSPRVHHVYSANNGSNVPQLVIVVNSFIPRAVTM